MADLIEPRLLRGFRDYPPELMLPRERLMETARKVYRSYGFAPIDTPALEYAEILIGKGGEESDKIVYRFRDHGDRDVALRFDLTVPFSRFAAQNANKLGTPFKRYHMGPVWRGENTGKGRFREFWQCDFDTIGTSTNGADIETALVIHDLFAALGFERFTIRINNRLLLNGVLEARGLDGRAVPILRALDKLDKIGPEGVKAELMEVSDETKDRAELSSEQADDVLSLVKVEGSNAEILDQVEKEFGSEGATGEGLTRLRELLDVASTVGIPEERLRIDLAICRGLDYYTGTIYETFLGDKPDIGSVCSGGRYDNLAGKYTKQQLPGVGASLGLDRLLAAMQDLGMLPEVRTPADVLVVQFNANALGQYHRIARELRAADVGVEVFPDPKKIGQQLQYAEKRGFRFALIAGDEELSAGTWKLKNLAERREETIAEPDLIAHVKAQLTI